jgi:hypothetical protein
MTDERARYLASGTGNGPTDKESLDLTRGVLGDEATWSQPPPEVADRLLATIAEERDRVSMPHARLRWWPWAAAFATVALLALVMGLLGVFDTPVQVIEMRGTDLEPTATGQAAIHETGSGWSIRLDVSGLPPADDGQYYEGWLWSDDGDGISVGTFNLREDDRSIVLWSGVDPDAYPSLWVTLEDEDGDPSVSDQVVMRGNPTSP